MADARPGPAHSLWRRRVFDHVCRRRIDAYRPPYTLTAGNDGPRTTRASVSVDVSWCRHSSQQLLAALSCMINIISIRHFPSFCNYTADGILTPKWC